MLIPKDVEICLEAQANQVGLKGILPVLVGIVMTESSGRWDALRHEPAYRWVVNARTGKAFRKLTPAEAKSKTPPEDFPGVPLVSDAQKEWDDQRTSWGPMQVMGAVARELGFTGDLAELSSHLGVEYGVKHFKALHTQFINEDGIEGVVEAYNRGSPDDSERTTYARKVFGYAEQFRKQAGG